MPSSTLNFPIKLTPHTDLIQALSKQWYRRLTQWKTKYECITSRPDRPSFLSNQTQNRNTQEVIYQTSSTYFTHNLDTQAQHISHCWLILLQGPFLSERGKSSADRWCMALPSPSDRGRARKKDGQTKAAIINFNQALSLVELIISSRPTDLRRWYNISLCKLLINLPH